jgi:hypothetical protein
VLQPLSAIAQCISQKFSFSKILTILKYHPELYDSKSLHNGSFGKKIPPKFWVNIEIKQADITGCEHLYNDTLRKKKVLRILAKH